MLVLVDVLTETAAAIQAVNTIYLKENQIIGENTDVPGFAAALQRACDQDGFNAPSQGSAIILGAGGSARAVVYALDRADCQITLAARRLKQADELLNLGRKAEAIADYERILELGSNIELSLYAAEQLMDLSSPAGTSTGVSAAQPGTNLALRKKARVSRMLADFPASFALDGAHRSWWSSGDFAQQWILIDLGANYVISEVRLLPAQSPTGKTIHNLYAKGPATDSEYSPVHTFEGVTLDGVWVTYTLPEPLRGVRYILVETTTRKIETILKRIARMKAQR